MPAVNGVQSDSQAVSCVRVMVSGQLCLRVVVKQSIVVNGVSFVLYGMRGVLVLCGVHFVLMVCKHA